MHIRLILLLVLAPAVLFGQSPEKVAARLTSKGFVATFARGNTLSVQIPRIYVYNAAGQRVADMSGYGAQTISAIEQAQTRKAGANAPRLESFMELITDFKGRPIELAGTGYPTLVTFGAEWCAPCRRLHQEVKGLRGFNIIEVDADIKRADQRDIYKEIAAAARRP